MLAQLANAQDKDGLSVGFVALSSQSAYTSSATNRLLPSLRYQSGPLSIGLPDGIKYRFAQNERISGAVALKALVAPYNSGDADQLSGMKRDMGFDAGITADFTIVHGTTLLLHWLSLLADKIGGKACASLFANLFQVWDFPFSSLLGHRCSIKRGATIALVWVQTKQQQIARPMM